jgi:hypothetical protein
MQAMTAVFGFIILLVGRQFYMTFVAGMFFLASAYLIDRLWGTPAGFQAVWVPLLFAALGWGLTLELRRWVARPAIFLAGVYVFMQLPLVLGMAVPQHWLFFALGGVFFLLLSLLFFDITLIVLSMLTGATMIMRSVAVPEGLNLALLVLMMIFSLGAQLVIMRYGQRAPD